MIFKKFGRTANLFDYSSVTLGKYINASGQEATSTGEGEAMLSHSDFISVQPNTQYNFKVTKAVNESATNNAFCWFDNNKEIISRNLFDGEGSSDYILGTYTSPNNAAYLIMNYRGLHGDTGMLNTGSTALPYQPYKDWIDTPHYIHNTSTDTITTPADIYANDTTATVGLKGNMEQTGAPTPTTPIQPSECGERTGNLIDVNVSEAGGISDTGELINNNPNTWRSTVYYDIDTTLNYVASKAKQTIRINYYDASKNHISREGVTQDTYKQLTIPSNARYFKWTLYDNNGIPDIQAARSIKPMINVGTTAFPYEPYGYKIPISSANTTTPVYLGEVQTTRKIYKYTFTGQEEWARPSSNIFRVGISGYLRQSDYTPICTHYKGQSAVRATSELGDYSCAFLVSSSGNNYYYIRDLNYDAYTDFKAYLAQQYAAGTPVTVWYILAEPTTGIVNEPIRKIGDYADEVSGITIPTIAGANTISVDTTLQPSEATVNYKGWHPVQSVHERESGAWT